jgi:outer membrane protein assembly factor BamB
VAWFVSLPGLGNATPVVVEDRICLTREPVDLLCLGAEDGQILWSATNTIIDTLSGEERAAAEQKRQRAAELDATAKVLREEIRTTQRLLYRSGVDAGLTQRIEELERQLRPVVAELDPIAHYFVLPPLTHTGYATQSPITDGQSLYVAFYNGVVSRFDRDGTRRWSVFIGEPVTPMLGELYGPGSTPILHDGMVIIGHRNLVALDAATGRLLWRTEDLFRDHGTPALVDIDGEAVLVTASGTVVRARDGRVLARELGEIWYVSPYAVGRTIYFIGFAATMDIHKRMTPPHSYARAVRLEAIEGDTLRWSELWETDIAAGSRFLASPLLHDGLLYAADESGTLHVFRTEDGVEIHESPLPLRDTIGASPMLVGADLFLLNNRGSVFALTPGPAPEIQARYDLPDNNVWATPVLHAGRLFIHGDAKLFSIPITEILASTGG